MRLRYIANIRLPTEKAHGIQIMEMCAAFALAGVQVELVIPGRKTNIEEDPFSYYGIPRVFKIRTLSVPDYTRLGNTLGASAHWLHRWHFARAAIKDALRNPVVPLHSSESLFPPPLWGRLGGGKEADYPPPFPSPQRGRENLVKAWEGIYYHRDEFTFRCFALAGLPSLWEVHDLPNNTQKYRDALKKSLGVVAITRGLAEKLIELNVAKEKILVAPDGINLKKIESLPSKNEARKKLGLPEDKIIVLYAGQLYPWKGVDTLIRASAGLPEDMRVIIAGGMGNRLEELKKLSKDCGANNIEFTGQVKHEIIFLYLAAADMAVIPNSAAEEISRIFTSPLKLFEAMATGKAIIASDLPSIREIIDESCAVLFQPDDSRALAQALRELAGNPARRERISGTAKKLSFNYDWGARANKILHFINETFSAG